MDEIYSIKEISELLKIAKTTLRYWESEGLFASPRNRGNNYREFSLDLLLDIGDIAFYRGLGVPIRDLKDARRMTIENIRDTLSASMGEVEAQVARLMAQRDSIAVRLSNLDEIERLRRGAYEADEKIRPDFKRAVVVDYSDRDHWRMYLTSPE